MTERELISSGGTAEIPKREAFTERIIEASARNKFLVFVFTIFAVAAGFYGLTHTPLDAIPDLSDVQVIVYTDWEGRSPDLVEDQITYPISTVFIAAPKVKFVRGESMFGKSFVYVIFEDGTDIYWARSRVIEYLNSVRGSLPEGVNPTIGPDATGLGWVYEYALVDDSGKHDLAALRSIQDWNLRYALESVKGVAEVAPIGGFVKQYQVDLDPNALVAYNIPLSDVVSAIKTSNADVGGKTFEIATTEYFVRGRGYIKSVADIENIVLKVDKGTPVYVKNVGTVHLGGDIRRGVAELDGKGETVGGIVVMRYGENALNVIDGIKKKIEEIKPSLPPGVRIVPTYDRSELIRRERRRPRAVFCSACDHSKLCPGLFAYGAGGPALPAARLYKNVRNVLCRVSWRHTRASADDAAHSRENHTGREKSSEPVFDPG